MILLEVIAYSISSWKWHWMKVNQRRLWRLHWSIWDSANEYKIGLSHPERVDAFMQLHADWVDEPDWHDPFFPLHCTLAKPTESNYPSKCDCIFEERLGCSSLLRRVDALCGLSLPRIFWWFVDDDHQSTPTPSEVIHRNVIRNAILGLGRIRVALSQEDWMLILENQSHYRREVLPLVHCWPMRNGPWI